MSVETDRRHDRRSISDDEFRRLIEAADEGQSVEGLAGSDRAKLYILAAWTGYRRRELASLTRRSFDLVSETPTVKVEAAYSQRRRNETIPLHALVVEKLKMWFDTKGEMGAGVPLFELRTWKGHLRKTSKMMRRDLSSSRATWLKEADDDQEREKREASDFLAYQDEDGLFADFHANRHTFISNLSRAGVPLAMAQKLARHSDPRLTANRYTHLELDEKAKAIGTMPGLHDAEASLQKRDGKETVVAGMVAGILAVSSRESAPVGTNGDREHHQPPKRKPRQEPGFGMKTDQLSANVKVHPEGVEFPSFSRGIRTF